MGWCRVAASIWTKARLLCRRVLVVAEPLSGALAWADVVRVSQPQGGLKPALP